MPVKYDQFVKRPGEEIEYTPENIIELGKCRDSLFHFIKYVKIVNPDEGEILYEPYDFQTDLLNLYNDNRFSVSLCSRQSGKTTTVCVYALWYALFNKDKNIGIVSNKESSAKMILARLKRMWEGLPAWLKPGAAEYSKMFVTFDNGTRIFISATSADAFRGESMNLLICDEFAFVPGNQAEEFWASNYPTISASKKAKIIIISTPNGLFNIFHRIYSQAEASLNTFKYLKVTWSDVPGRNAEWAEEQIANLGKIKFAQEFNVEFIGSTNTVIDPEVLKVLNRLSIYEKPEEGATYILGVDPAKGTGENWSVIQVLKLIRMVPVKMQQVAVFRHNQTDVYDFSDIVNRLSYFYNNAHIMCENNGEGSAVIQRIWWEHENENLVNTGMKTANLGIRATKTTKPRAVLLMKKLIEDGSIILVDRETIEELGSFIEEKGKFFGKDKPDDCVCALYWGSYILEMNIFDESFSFEKKKDSEEEIWGILSDIEDNVEDWSWVTNSSLYD
jgi:hypothetical protein